MPISDLRPAPVPETSKTPFLYQTDARPWLAGLSRDWDHLLVRWSPSAGIAWVLRGPGGTAAARAAGSGTLEGNS